MDLAFSVDLQLIIQLLVSTVLPLIVALVTKRTTPGGVQAVLLATLAVVSSGLTELLASIRADEPFDVGVWLVAAIGSFVVGVATHYGLWKPTGTTTKALAVGDKTLS